MTKNTFNDRMRERMPAHGVWRSSIDAPSLSRPANDAMWDDMRTRLRVYEEQRREMRRRRGLGLGSHRLDAGATSSVVVVAAAVVLLVVALFGLSR